MTTSSKGDEVLDYRTLRQVVGALGWLLPIVLALWGFLLCGRIELQSSISAYYDLRTRDVLVGTLFAIAWFLYAYRPYEADPDPVAGKCACFFALGVALFPESGSGLERAVHFISALGLFFTLSCFCLFLFTRSGAYQTPRKKIRNRIYKICGVSILICIGLIGLYYWLGQDTALLRSSQCSGSSPRLCGSSASRGPSRVSYSGRMWMPRLSPSLPKKR